MSHAAFLNSIIAAPDDDLPRLVYADYLDDAGDSARAEFIRTQIELAKLPDHAPRRRPLEDREHELLGEHEAGWIGAGADGLQEWDWRRGFVEQVTATIQDVRGSLFDSGPLCDLTLTTSTRHPWHEHTDDMLAAAEWAPHVQSLNLSSFGWAMPYCIWAVSSPRWERLRGLNLFGMVGFSQLATDLRRMHTRNQLDTLSVGGRSTHQGVQEAIDPAALVSALRDVPLTSIGVSDAGLTTAGVRALLSAPFAATLKHLDISDNPIAPDGYRAFEQAHRSLRLDKLDVSGTPLAGISLEPLLHASCLELLTKLEMNGCGSARRNMEVLARSPFWAQATELRAHSGTIPASTLEPLCGSSGPPALRLLDLADNYVRTEGVRMLCEAPWAGSLTWLALSGNYLDDEACRLLARSGRFTHLRTLHLAHNNIRQDRSEGEQITDRGVQAMADDPSLANLRLLTLGSTGITYRGVEIALNAPYWRLFGLGLSGNDLTPEVVRVLAGSPRLSRFVWLDLANNPRLRGAALRPLAESPHLSRLCELDCGGIDLDDEVRMIFRDRLGPRFSH